MCCRILRSLQLSSRLQVEGTGAITITKIGDQWRELSFLLRKIEHPGIRDAGLYDDAGKCNNYVMVFSESPDSRRFEIMSPIELERLRQTSTSMANCYQTRKIYVIFCTTRKDRN